MAKYQNVFQEAKRRRDDMTARGFVKEDEKYTWQAFVQEVIDENEGKPSSNPWGVAAYERAYGKEFNYGDETTLEDVKKSRMDRLVKNYKKDLKEVFNTNDFDDLAEKYKNDPLTNEFDITAVDRATSLDELIVIAREAVNVHPALFRNKKGRDRKNESSQMETFFSGFIMEVNVLVEEMNEEKMKYKY